MSRNIRLSAAGGAAGLINGLFGAGGGMVLVPLLGSKSGIEEAERFSASVAIITPICIISLLFSLPWQVTLKEVLPYLIGSSVGGIAAGLWGRKIPTIWLHRVLGGLILWGGIRYLC
ncbi:MAG: sulfite exporter TauE/SafE family protein [Oscillospiraceae bacterium]|nr:sulfite exporter TauE/SafE family protein [Oscillospiraceae bacterium]